MNELIAAAKAVINHWDFHATWKLEPKLSTLRAAVERAEKQESSRFKDWWKEHSIEWGWTLTEIDAERFWTAAQQAERERIKNIVRKAIPEKMWVYEQAILEKIDDL